jgi:hypothetical protein
VFELPLLRESVTDNNRPAKSKCFFNKQMAPIMSGRQLLRIKVTVAVQVEVHIRFEVNETTITFQHGSKGTLTGTRKTAKNQKLLLQGYPPISVNINRNVIVPHVFVKTIDVTTEVSTGDIYTVIICHVDKRISRKLNFFFRQLNKMTVATIIIRSPKKQHLGLPFQVVAGESDSCEAFHAMLHECPYPSQYPLMQAYDKLLLHYGT